METLAAIIPAAGYGTRMYPLSRAVKKEFLPLIDPDGRARPLIHILVEEAIACGANKVCIVLQPNHRNLFENYFHNDCDTDPGAQKSPDIAKEIERMRSRVVFAEQVQQWGYGHAIWSAFSILGHRPFLTMLGDHAFASNTSTRCGLQLMKTMEHIESGSLSAVSRTPEKDLQYFGTVRGCAIPEKKGLYEAEKIIEKPSIEFARKHLQTPGDLDKPYLCWFGIHLLTPTVIDCLDYLVRHREGNKEVGLTEAQEMARKREGYWVVELDGTRFDLGVPEGYKQSVSNWPGAIRRP